MSDDEKSVYKIAVERINRRKIGAYPLVITIAALVAMSFWTLSLWDDNQALKTQLSVASKDGSRSLAAAATATPVPQATAAANADGSVKVTGTIAPVTDKDHIQGSKDAPLMLITYTDMECPYCQRFHPTIIQIKKDYGDKVALVYRNFPLSFHANAQKKAESTECVAAQLGNDGFWGYVEQLMSKGSAVGVDPAQLAALYPGINASQLTKCMNDSTYAQKVKDDQASGVAAGISGTPGTFVVKKDGAAVLIPGAFSYAQVKTIIDANLQ